MNYRELLDLYKNGKLSDELRNQVEQDIERQDAIGEYLFDRETMEGMSQMPDLAGLSGGDSGLEGKDGSKMQEASDEFVTAINHRIRKAFAKMGMIVGSVILVVIMFVFLVLPKVVAKLYYDPSKVVTEQKSKEKQTSNIDFTNPVDVAIPQMALDLAVYTEVFIPGNYRDNVVITDRGYGRYDFTVKGMNVLDMNFKIQQSFSGSITRNQLVLYDPNAILQPQNVFAWTNRSSVEYPLTLQDEIERNRYALGENETMEHAQYDPSVMLERLRVLEGDRYYDAYVSFDRMMSYDELLQFLERYNLSGDIWCAVATKEASEQEPVSGIATGFYLKGVASGVGDYEEETYPHLRETHDDGPEYRSEDEQTQHMISMLRYLSDQTTFCEMIGQTVTEEQADYVEENGLKIYGFYMTATRNQMLKLCNRSEVYLVVPHEVGN